MKILRPAPAHPCRWLPLILYCSMTVPAWGQRYIYWSTGFNTIERANLDGSNRTTILSGLNGPWAIALDLVNNQIYWTETSANVIQRANLNGTSVETIVTSAGSPEGIAVDGAGGKIYWTQLNGFVQRANLDGSNIQGTLIPGRAIDLDLVHGKMYVCGGGGPSSGSGVRRADLDGSNDQELVGANSEVQQWIAVNPILGKVYFNSTGNGNIRINRMNLDGTDQEWSFIVDQFGDLSGYSYGMDINTNNGELYWRQNDYAQSVIRRSESDGSSRVDLVYYSMVTGGLKLDYRNTLPVASNPVINPPFPRAGQNLVASYTYSDADGDPQSGTQIRWYRNNIVQPAWNDLTTVSGSATTNGDTWYFTVCPNDGFAFGATNNSAAVIVSNRPPAASNLAITPAFPRAGRTLVAAYSYSDPNGDAESGSQLRWYRNGTNAAAYNNTNTVPGSATVDGDRWSFSVQPSDGVLFGNTATSAVVTVQNLAPSATNVSITPANPLLNQSLVANYTFNDPNGDAESGTQIRWFRNGLAVTAYNDQESLPANATSANDAWYFTVRPSDGALYGNTIQSATVQVQPDCYTPTNTVDFTSMGTFTTTNLHTGGVSVTATNSAGANGSAGVLNLNGLGVVGGISDYTLDGSESLRFQFDAGGVSAVSYFVGSAGNQNGNGTVGDAFLTALDVNGNSLGTVAVNGSGSHNVSAQFGNQLISAVIVKANADNQTIQNIQYRADASVSFAQAGFTVDKLGNWTGPQLTLVRQGSTACESAVLVNVTGGTAVTNADYIATNFPMSIVFPSGATKETVPVTVLENSSAQGTRTVNFSITSIIGCSIGGAGSATLNILDVPTPAVLGGVLRVNGGPFQFSFMNHTGFTFSVLSSSNLSLPFSNWNMIGAISDSPPGQYHFSDPTATNSPQRFYRLRWP